jgi:hypothetical protein
MDIKSSIISEQEKIPRYPLNGHSSYLFDKFYIFGYTSITLKKSLYNDETLKKILAEKKGDESRFQKFQLEQFPVLLNEFTNDIQKECLEIDMIREMILPKNINLYYTDEEKLNKSPDKRRKKESNKSLPIEIIQNQKDEESFTIYDEGIFSKVETPKSYNVIFSSNPQSGNNSKKSINGFAYVFYKKLSNEKKDISKNSSVSFYIPTIFCIISEYPFYNSFYQLCKEIEYLFTCNEIRIPLEIILYNLINLTPSPLNSDVFLSLKSITNLKVQGKINFKSLISDIIEEDNEENYDENKSQNLIDKLARKLTNRGKEQPKSSSFQRTNGIVHKEKERRERRTQLIDLTKLNTPGNPLIKLTDLKHVRTTANSIKGYNINKQSYSDCLQKIKFDFLTGYPLIQYNLAKVLLQTLSPIDVIDIFMYTFLEKDVLFFSKDIEFLSLTINSYLNLNFPLNDEKYYFINACVSYDNYINSNSTFVGSTFTTIIGINDQYNPKYQSESMNKLREHMAIDLDNGKVYKVEDKSDKEKSKKNKELFNYIKYICRSKENKNEKILYRETNLLHKVLSDIYSKMNDKEDEYYNIFKNNKYIDYSDEKIKEINLKIQDSFYRFINNINLYVYQNLLVKTEADDMKKMKDKLKNKNSNNNEDEDEYNVIYLDDYKNNDNDNIYSKEELYLLEEFQETMKFQSFVFSFVQSYNPIDLYKIPLTFTEEFISIISRKSCFLEQDINFLSLINNLYKTEGEINIDFETFLIEYYSDFEQYFDREILDIFENNKLHPDKIKIRNFNLDNNLIVQYKAYELDDKLLKKYIYLLNELEENENDINDINDSIYLLMKRRIKENIPKNISITDIESEIEKYAIEKGILSESDLCSANIILLFTLSLKSITNLFECQSFLGTLFQEFTIFRKYYSIILSMIYKMYKECLKKKDYIRAENYYNLHYFCINSLRSVKLIPNESLMNIIKLFNKKNVDKLKNEIEQNKVNGDTNIFDKSGLKLYGNGLPDSDITRKNLYVKYNFTFDRFVKENEILSIINEPTNKTKYYINIDENKKVTPKIKFDNGIHSFESNLFSQKYLLSILVEEYQNYIEDLDENNLNSQTIMDACVNTFLFIRNYEDFIKKDDIYKMVKNIFYIFLNHFIVKK